MAVEEDEPLFPFRHLCQRYGNGTVSTKDECPACEILRLRRERDDARTELYVAKMTCSYCAQYGDGCNCTLIDVDNDWTDDPELPARYLRQLTKALWRHQEIETWATIAPVIVACSAIGGDEGSRAALDCDPAWRAF